MAYFCRPLALSVKRYIYLIEYTQFLHRFLCRFSIRWVKIWITSSFFQTSRRGIYRPPIFSNFIFKLPKRQQNTHIYIYHFLQKKGLKKSYFDAKSPYFHIPLVKVFCQLNKKKRIQIAFFIPKIIHLFNLIVCICSR